MDTSSPESTPAQAVSRDTPTHPITLREVIPSDLEVFFAQQLDPAASFMAAFTAPDPQDRPAFDARWARILADNENLIRTILHAGNVVGYISAFERFGNREIGYWLGRAYWGQGIATGALHLFLATYPPRPLYARVVHDNLASLRVLTKCGFLRCGTDRAFAQGRAAEVEEIILVLQAPTPL